MSHAITAAPASAARSMHTVVLAVPVGAAQEGADDCGEEALAVVNVRPKWLVQVRLDKHRGFREETTKPCPV